MSDVINRGHKILVHIYSVKISATEQASEMNIVNELTVKFNKWIRETNVPSKVIVFNLTIICFQVNILLFQIWSKSCFLKSTNRPPFATNYMNCKTANTNYYRKIIP